MNLTIPLVHQKKNGQVHKAPPFPTSSYAPVFIQRFAVEPAFEPLKDKNQSCPQLVKTVRNQNSNPTFKNKLFSN